MDIPKWHDKKQHGGSKDHDWKCHETGFVFPLNLVARLLKLKGEVMFYKRRSNEYREIGKNGYIHISGNLNANNQRA